MEPYYENIVCQNVIGRGVMSQASFIRLMALFASFNPVAAVQSLPVCGGAITAAPGTVPSFELILGYPTSGSRNPDPSAEVISLVTGTLDAMEARARDYWIYVYDDDDIPFTYFDRTRIVHEVISQVAGLHFKLYFLVGSNVEEILAVELNLPPGSIISDGNGTEYPIRQIGCMMGDPPSTLSPTISPSASPSSSVPTAVPSGSPTAKPTQAQTQSPSPTPTCSPTTTLVEPDYCPCGYHDYGVRYTKALGRITVVWSHQECADRCTKFSGSEFNGGCRGFMTGMYFNMLFCRSYGAITRATACAPWAKPNHAGFFSGVLGSLREQTGQFNVGGNCCSNTTFVDITG